MVYLSPKLVVSGLLASRTGHFATWKSDPDTQCAGDWTGLRACQDIVDNTQPSVTPTEKKNNFLYT
jgi:hypothetical protein